MTEVLEIHTTTLEQLRRCPEVVWYRLTHPHLVVPSEGQTRGRRFHEICGSLLHQQDPSVLDAINLSFGSDPALANAARTFWLRYVHERGYEWLAYEETFRRPFDLGYGYPQAVFMGTIDLVAREPATGKCLIIDLKLYKKPSQFWPGLQRITYGLLSRWLGQASDFVYAIFSHDGSLTEHPFPLADIYTKQEEYMEELRRLGRFYARIRELHYKNPNLFCRSCNFYEVCRPFGESDNKDIVFDFS